MPNPIFNIHFMLQSNLDALSHTHTRVLKPDLHPRRIRLTPLGCVPHHPLTAHTLNEIYVYIVSGWWVDVGTRVNMKNRYKLYSKSGESSRVGEWMRHCTGSFVILYEDDAQLNQIEHTVIKKHTHIHTATLKYICSDNWNEIH